MKKRPRRTPATPAPTAARPAAPAEGKGLWTDLYQFTTALAYQQNSMNQTATFEMFVRSLPPERGYLLVAGIEEAIDYVDALRFDEEEIGFIRSLPQFRGAPEDFFDWLRRFRFSGDVRAMPEGTPVFALEPIMQVTAPLPEAQIVETYLLSVVNFQTTVATKAARMVQAARGRGVVDFGFRRAHGPHAAVGAARAAYLAGCAGTTNVEAGRRYGIPVFGTASHAFVTACESETDAFRLHHKAFGGETLLLVDTYDALGGVKHAVALGDPIKGVRVDSGDLLALSNDVRRILDEAGYRETRIIASGRLNEHRIAELLAVGAPIDIFGVGTDLVTSRDAPALEGIYKLVEIGEGSDARCRLKTSSAKETLPGRKQVFRGFDAAGRPSADRIARAGEPPRPGERPLLDLVMRGGRRVGDRTDLDRIRAAARDNLAGLPEGVRALSAPAPYPVRLSEALADLETTVRREIAERDRRS